VKGWHAMVAKGVGGENDIPTRIDGETKMDKEIPKLRFYYIIPGVVCVSYSLHSH
jgi:hypothetical protein